MKKILFNITAADKNKFVRVIKDYLVHIKNYPEILAKDRANEYFFNMICGFDFDGNIYTKIDLMYLDERLSDLTEGFFTPVGTEIKRYKIGNAHRYKKKDRKPATTQVSQNEVNKMRKVLLREYPFLSGRKDLENSIYNYCVLSCKIKTYLNSDDTSKGTQVKNLIEAQIRLGSFLGINESERQKAKLAESKDNIASLVAQFQKTIEEFPEIMEEFRFFELKMLLNKFERKEINRTLFESQSYADMSIESAQEFVMDHEAKYE